MILLYCLILAIYQCYALQYKLETHYLLVSLGISVVYYTQQNLHDKAKSFNKILQGELPTHLLFIGWLYYYKPAYFLHYIPLLLSNSGKMYWILKQKNGQLSSFNQQFVVFQCQCEAFVSLTLFISALSFTPSKILEFLLYVLIIKIKYRFYAPTHKAFNQLHFLFDRLSRNLKFRSFYHLIYQMISCFSNDVYSVPMTWQILY